MKNTKFENFPKHFELKVYEGADKSGVSAFQIGENYIIIKFKDEKIYLYDEQRPGKMHVNEMKNRAVEGKQLSTYINKKIKENYAAIWDNHLRKFKSNKTK
jgi:hypothetical protein